MGFCKGVEVLTRTQTYSMNQPSGCHGCKVTRMHELSLNWTADTLSLRGAERKGSGRGGSLNFPPNSGRECTLCFVLSVPIFCFDFFRKFRLPNGLHRSWSISPKAGGTCRHGPDLIDLRQPLEGAILWNILPQNRPYLDFWVNCEKKIKNIQIFSGKFSEAVVASKQPQRPNLTLPLAFSWPITPSY